MPARRRLFVAVWPPAELIDALVALERPQVKGLRWTTRDQWHVTLRFLGSVAEEEVESVVGALDGLAGLPRSSIGLPVVAVAGPRPERLGRAVWMLPVAGLDALAAAVRDLLYAAGGGWGQPEDDRAFNGHVTLARAKAPSALRGLPAPPTGSSWTVSEVTLVNSTLDPRGARYEVVERWRL